MAKTEVLNKKGLIEAVSEKTGCTKKSAEEMVNVIIDEMVSALKNGEAVDLYGFGKFEVKERKSRTGINPATKETIEIAASKVPTFKAAKALKEAVK